VGGRLNAVLNPSLARLHGQLGVLQRISRVRQARTGQIWYANGVPSDAPIASTLILPTEMPPSLLDVKRALLTFDTINLLAPDDRDVIPAHNYVAASSGGLAPFGINRGPVRPHGKLPGYDDAFEKLVDEAAQLKQQGLLTVLPTPTVHQGMIIGWAIDPNAPHPAEVFWTYSLLAGDPEFVRAASTGFDALRKLPPEHLAVLAPPGAEEVPMQFAVNSQTVQSAPFTIVPASPDLPENDRMTYTRLARARLGTLVKAFAHCTMRNLHPYCSDAAAARVLSLLQARTLSATDSLVAADPSLSTQRRLAVLHQAVLADRIDDDALNKMSLQEVLKQRTAAWGAAMEARSRLFAALRKIAFDNPTEEQFQKACAKAIDEYLRASGQYEHQSRNLHVTVLLSFLAVFAAMAAQGVKEGPAGSDALLQHVSSAWPLWLLLAISSVSAWSASQVPKIRDLLKQQRDVEGMPGYALHAPYAPFLAK
jgi:hypothetical protein